MPQLYVLAQEYRDAAESLADMDLDAQTIADTLESMSGDLETKAMNVALFARNLQVTSAAMKDAEAQLAARRKAVDNRVDGIIRYLLESMRHAGISKIESAYLRLNLRDNPPAVEVFDEAQIPAKFMRQPKTPTPEPDKVAIKAALTAGEYVVGARLTHGVRLEIK